MGPAGRHRDLALAGTLVAWGLVACGAAARVVRWAANRSLWGDEGSLAINLVERTPAALAAPLAHDQAAPIGFLLLEKAAIALFGEGELALRALPLAASLAALPVFFAFARELVDARAARLALVLFALCEPLVFYASEVKPYATDVLVALLVLWPAARLLARGASARRLAALGAAGSLAPWLSLPGVFACGGAALALGAAFARRRQSGALRAVAGLAALWLASFAVEYLWLLRAVRANALLAESWRGYFAPLPVSADALRWWARALLGFFNDPLGLPASGLAALLFALGLAALARRAPAAAALLLAPLGLALAASVAGLAPFPTSSLYRLSDRYYPFYGRLILFGVPLALPVVATGVRALLDARRRAVSAAGALALAWLLVAPARQLFVNLADPPRIHEARPLFARLAERFAPGDRIYAQQYATGVVAYYARRAGMGPIAGELALERPNQIVDLYFRLRGMREGDRFWLVTLHHPHWRSEAERDAIRAALASVGEPVETLEGERAEATLYRVRPQRRPAG
jgi:hypothetical protein